MPNHKLIPTIASKTHCDLKVDQFIDVLDLNSPALYVMTDFSRRSPNVIDENATIDEAVMIMQKSHVKSKLVVDGKMQIQGIVNLRDLLSRKVLKAASERGILRQDITVHELMVSVNNISAISYEKVCRASIGDILTTMQSLGEQHLLVMDDSHNLRGIVSVVDISRALHTSVNVDTIAHSFKDVFSVIHYHNELN